MMAVALWAPILWIDRKIMAALTWATSTKGAFYALLVLIAVAVYVKPPSDVQGWLLVLVSELYQGVALPGLGAAQQAEAEETRKLLQETHDATMQELAEQRAERQELHGLVQEVHELVTYLHQRLDEKEA